MNVAHHPPLGFPRNPLIGKKYKLLSYKHNDVIMNVPIVATRSDGYGNFGNIKGDVPIGNANSNIVFIPYTGIPGQGIDFFFWKKDPTDGCNLFVCDRNIIGGVPWNRLNALGFILGNGAAANMVVGNMHFQCRSLKGGKSMTGTGEQSNTYGLSTAPANYDEWDDLFGGLIPTLGVPVPTATEAKLQYSNNGTPTLAQYLAETNQFFHWVDMYTWCQETMGNGGYACLRGYYGPRHWHGNRAPSNTYAAVGFRPVLKDLESGNLKSGFRAARYFFMPFDPVPGQKYDLLSAKMNGTLLNKNAIAQGDKSAALEFVDKTDNADEAISGIYQGINADGNDEFLVDRPIACGIPFNRLNELGLITGVSVALATLGQVTVRAPKGGIAKDGASDVSAGVSTVGKDNNEWDDTVGCLDVGRLIDVPKPAATPAANDDHDQYFHWSGKATICQKAVGTTIQAPVRGKENPRQWATVDPASESADIAYRPIIEVTRPAWNLGEKTGVFTLSLDTSTWTEDTAVTLSAKLDGKYEIMAPTGHTPGPITVAFPEARWTTLAAGDHQIVFTLQSQTTNLITEVVVGFNKPLDIFTNIAGGGRLPVAGNLTFNLLDGVTGYTAQIADDAKFTRNVAAFTGTASPIAYSGLTLNRDYYLRMVATTSGGDTQTSTPLLVHCGDKLEFTTAKLSSAAMPDECTPKVFGRIDPRANQQYWVCNNGNDPEPQKAWEPCTSEVNQGKHTFANKTKVADTWALQMKVVVMAGQATGDINIYQVMF